MTQPALTIDIGAKTDQYDKAMKSIGDKADAAVSKIESKFDSFNPQLNTEAYAKSLGSMVEFAAQLAIKLGAVGVAGAAIGGAAAGFAAVLALTVKLNESLAQTADTAERVGISFQKYQELKFGANSIGTGDDEFNASLDNFAKNLQNAQFKSNDLTRAFAANGVAISDSNGKLKDTTGLLNTAITLVQRQKTIQDAIQVGGFFGFSSGFSQSIKDAGGDFQKLSSQAQSAGAVIDDSTIEKAKEFTKQWNAASAQWGVNLKAAIEPILPLLDDAASGAIKILNAVGKTYSFISSIRNDAATQNAANGEIGVFDTGFALPPAKVEVTGGTTETTPLPRSRPSNAPKPPQPANNPGPGQDGGADAVQRAIDSLNKHTLQTEADAKAVGLGADALARFRAEAQETAAVQKNGGKETADQAAQFKVLEAAAGAAAEALAKAQVNNAISRGRQTAFLDPQDVAIANQLKDIYPDVATAMKSPEAEALRLNQAISGVSSSISNDLTSGLTDIATGAKSASQGFSDMAASIIKDIEQMVIKLAIVQPLMQGLQSIGGGVLSTFGISVPKFAGGTDNAPGGLSLVGERGPELVNLPRGSQVIPNDVLRGGGGSTSQPIVYNIDASGADSGTVARIQSVLAAHAQAIQGQGKAMQSAQRYQSTGVG